MPANRSYEGLPNRARRRSIVLAVMTLLTLAACGGGGGGSSPPAPPPEPPPVLPAAETVKVSAASPLPAGCEGPAGGGTAVVNAETEPYVAVNPINPLNLFAVWQQDRWTNGGARGLVGAFSLDGGRSWTSRTVPFSHCTGGNASNGGDYPRVSDPWVSFGPTGVAHQIALSFSGDVFLAGSSSAILVSRSSDGGQSWSTPITLIRDGASFFNDKEAITADPNSADHVYAVWDRLAASGGGPTWFARSTDGGLSWEAARPIYDPGSRSQTIGNIVVVLPDGRLLNLFTQIDTDSSNRTSAHFAVLRSADRGQTWSAPVRIADALGVGARDPQTNARVRDGAGIASIAVAPNGQVYVSWQDARGSGGQRDAILLSRSDDGGSSWTAPVRVNPDPAVAAFTPAVFVAGDGTLGISYHDFRSNTADPATLFTDYWLARSRDGGASFSETRLASPFDLNGAPNANGLFLGDYQGLAAAGDRLLPVFVRTTGESANPTDVFVAPALALGVGVAKSGGYAAATVPAAVMTPAFEHEVSERLQRRLKQPGLKRRAAR